MSCGYESFNPSKAGYEPPCCGCVRIAVFGFNPSKAGYERSTCFSHLVSHCRVSIPQRQATNDVEMHAPSCVSRGFNPSKAGYEHTAAFWSTRSRKPSFNPSKAGYELKTVVLAGLVGPAGFNPSKAGYERSPLPRIADSAPTSFNPSKAGYELYLFLASRFPLSSFNPSKAGYERRDEDATTEFNFVVSIPQRQATNTPAPATTPVPGTGFQSLKGRLRTVSRTGAAARKRVFQSLKGRLRTAAAISAYGVYSVSFNPSKAGYELGQQTVVGSVTGQFQSLKGRLRTDLVIRCSVPA